MAATATATTPPPTAIKLIYALSHPKPTNSFLPSPPKPSPFLRLSISAASKYLYPLLRLAPKNPPFFFSSFAAHSSSAWAQQEVELAEEGEEGGFLDSGEEEAFVEPPEEAKLFVGNLSYDVDSQGLAELFQRAGTVEIAEVIYNRETDRSRGFGFITMSTVKEADKAIELFNRYDMNGRLLSVNKAAPRGARLERTPRPFEPSFRIYVGNLSWEVDDARLEQVFSEHGKVVDARVVYDRDSGRSRGFGFVTMASEKEMGDAITALDGQSLDGRAVRVNVAEERPRRGSF